MYVVIFSQLIQQKHNSYTMANYSTFSIEIEKRLKSILRAYNNWFKYSIILSESLSVKRRLILGRFSDIRS